MSAVSLIVPVYNAGEFFPSMLESVLAQTHGDIQLIVVNDGSTDGSAAVFRQFEPRLRERLSSVLWLEHGSNQSASQAMNTALPHCTGEYLMWADADDLLAPENVASKAAFLDAHPEFALVRCSGIQTDLNTGEEQELAKPSDKHAQDVFEALLTSGTYCHCGCYMVRADAFFDCYPDRRIPVSRQGQNMQMLLPPASLSRCGYIDERLYTYRIHEKNHSRSFVTYPARLERINGFEAMQLQVLPHCRVDQTLWAQRVEQIWSTARDNLRREYVLRIRQNVKRGGRP